MHLTEPWQRDPSGEAVSWEAVSGAGGVRRLVFCRAALRKCCRHPALSYFLCTWAHFSHNDGTVRIVNIHSLKINAVSFYGPAGFDLVWNISATLCIQTYYFVILFLLCLHLWAGSINITFNAVNHTLKTLNIILYLYFIWILNHCPRSTSK